MHLVNHVETRQFKCDICEVEFYTGWRLDKHQKSHEDQNQKFCHYFNNGKSCPYEDLGCKFKHKVSKECPFQDKCYRKLCQYKHTDMGKDHREEIIKEWKCEELNWSDEPCAFKSTLRIRFKNHMTAYHELGWKHFCDECNFGTENRKELKTHIENIHGTKFLTCDGNCNDRLYEENAFTCDVCKDFARKDCGLANIFG